MGEILLLVSLTCDGVTGAVQERMKSEHQTKSGHMMRSMNKWSVLFLAVALTATGELWDFLGFVSRHPSVLWQIGLFSVASALGQYFIFMCVSEFGPLPCSIVTTTRKFFTVLASVVFFGNALVQRQWLGATLVFMGMIEIPSSFLFQYELKDSFGVLRSFSRRPIRKGEKEGPQRLTIKGQGRRRRRHSRTYSHLEHGRTVGKSSCRLSNFLGIL